MSGGTFTASSGSFTIAGSFTVTNSPTFTANGGTVTFDTHSASVSISCNGITFNSVALNKVFPDQITIASGCTVPLGNAPTTIATIVNNGTITAGTGTWLLNGGDLTNTGTITSSLTKIDINNSNGGGSFSNSGSITMGASPQIDVEGSFTQSAGSLPSGVALTMNGGNTSTLTCTSYSFGSVTITKTFGSTGITIASNCNLPSLGNNPSTQGTITNNGTINAGTGTWTFVGSLVNNGTITTSLTKIDLNASNGGASFTANTGSTLTMGASPQIDVEESFTYTGGTLPSGIALTANGGSTATITCGSYSFGGTTTISKSFGTTGITIDSTCTLPSLGNSPSTAGAITNNGTMSAGTGTWTVSGNFTNAGTFSSSLTRIDVNDFFGGGVFTSSSGTMTMGSSPQIDVDRDFVYTSGTLPVGIGLYMTSGATANLTCGSYTLGSTTINKSNTLTITSDCSISGDFARTAGAIANPASAKIITVGGNFSMSATDLFGGSNLTFEFNGSADKTITQNAGTFSSKLKVNKSVGKALTMATNLVLGNTLDVTSGTFDQGATFNLTTGGVTTISSLGTWLNSSASPTQRTWSGAGTFTLYDLAVSNMAGSMTTRSSTNTSNNTWTFANCNSNPSNPSSLGPTGMANGAHGTDHNPVFNFTIADADLSDTVKFRIIIDNDSNFSSPAVDYTSGFNGQGAATFTVGQAEGTGTYSTGSEGQTLSDDSYYWEVNATDNNGASSSFAVANSGDIAFVITTPVVVVTTTAPGNGPPELFGKINGQVQPVITHNPIVITGSGSISVFKHTLSPNNTGDDVKQLQIFLNTHGYVVSNSGPGSSGSETLMFGALTRKAVQKFQCATGIVCTGTPTTTGYGRVGPKTLNMINILNK